MPIKKSAKKALKQSKKNRAKNLMAKTKIRDHFKKIEELISSKKKDEAVKELQKIDSLLDKAWKQKVMKKNTVGRKKSRLRRKLNQLNHSK